MPNFLGLMVPSRDVLDIKLKLCDSPVTDCLLLQLLTLFWEFLAIVYNILNDYFVTKAS